MRCVRGRGTVLATGLTRTVVAGLVLGQLFAACAVQAQSARTGAAPAEELRYRLDTLDAEIADIRARLGGVAPGAGVAAGALSGSRLVELEGEIRRLTAAVEELQNRQRRIAEEAARRFSDIEFRLVELEGGDIGSVAPVPPLGGVETAAAPPAGTATGAPPTGFGTPAPPTGFGTGAPPTGFGTAAPRAPAEAPVVSVAEQGDLDRAVTDVRQGRFDQAEERLRRFLREYPASPLAGDAWYWLGESQFIRGQHGEAARSYLSGYNANRAGKRAPHNLYRLGVTLGRLGQRNEACLTLRELRWQFPTAPDNLVDMADSEADALACG